MKYFNIFAIVFTLLLGSAAANATLVEFTFEGDVGDGTEADFGDGVIGLNGASLIVTGNTLSDTNQAAVADDYLGMYAANATFQFFDSALNSLGVFTTNLFYYQNCDDNSSFGCIGLDSTVDGIDGFEVDFGYQHGVVNADPRAGAVVLGSNIDCDGFNCQTLAFFQPVVFENTTLGTFISLNLSEDAIHTYSVIAAASSVPAPAGIVLLGLGLIGLGLGRGRKQAA